MIDPMFWNVNRLFVLQFKNGDNDRIRTSFDEYYIPLVEIKDCNALVDNKPFFCHLIKNKRETNHTSKNNHTLVWKTCWNAKKQ